MKQIFVLLILLFPLAMKAQERYDALLEYKMQTNFSGMPTTYKAALYCNSTNALFIYQDQRKETINSVDEESLQLQYFVADTTAYFIKTDSVLTTLARSTKKEGGLVLIEEKVPQIEWKIDSEFKNIDGYECIKATCNFRGRYYTAWYAPEIPIKYGPFKFHGLPGALFELYDSHHEVVFTLSKVKIESGIVPSEPIKTKYLTISRDLYKKAQKEQFERIKRTLTSRSDRDMQVSITSFKVNAIEMD
ncbi:GLPGLI family protein [Porphyromonas levii]|uniref:GLPGLI family protein n=1 Tax=Porphyromonas levii TaxID=28114 RepID=UPI001B8CD418|nr:GLPGLI family protein [Porphyromonas levii]MBR8703122.1 hypothetical protein [Porphyromonas levii]MBR8713313.1 hypothetical protein [Porphyromonas levii]MBR8715318.1 hypothetical protein [Porphyromonas levii]MBR8727844.1 hypothetical protein [Porphyromonas levii]MBR8730296.1 hypothetical protein [Porphyromonas levii]